MGSYYIKPSDTEYEVSVPTAFFIPNISIDILQILIQ